MVFNKQNPPLGYYVYAYIRNKDSTTAKSGTPYYIGKGKNKRAYDKNHSTFIPKDQSKIIILEHNLTEVGALAIERRMIAWYGRKDLGTGILRNKTDGGEGASGVSMTNETRKKMSIAAKKRGVSKEHMELLTKLSKGKKLSEEHKSILILSNIGKKRSDEHVAKMVAARKGKIISEETRAKMRASRLAYVERQKL